MDKMMNAAFNVDPATVNERSAWSDKNFVESVAINDGKISSVKINGVMYDDVAARELLLSKSTGVINGKGDCAGWVLSVATEGLDFKHV